MRTMTKILCVAGCAIYFAIPSSYAEQQESEELQILQAKLAIAQAEARKAEAEAEKAKADAKKNRTSAKAESAPDFSVKFEGVAEEKAVMTSVENLLNYVEMPNERRLGVLSRSLESCPKDFQEAVIKYLDSVGKKVDDYMPETNENFEKEVERELYRTIRRGSPIDVNPQFAGMKMLAVADAVDIVKRSRESSIESAKLKMKTEIENAFKHIIDIAEKYGVDPIKLENALLN